MQIGYSAMGIHKQGMFISFHQNFLRHGCWLAKSSTPKTIYLMFFAILSNQSYQILA